MALNIKDPETERLATEIAALTGESKTAVIRDALRDRRAHVLADQDREERDRRALRFLQDEIWPQIPDDFRNARITKEDREDILGCGPDGV
jgi:antitoxin VapB